MIDRRRTARPSNINVFNSQHSIDYVCVDARVFPDITRMYVQLDSTARDGALWSIVSDHRPVVVETPWKRVVYVDTSEYVSPLTALVNRLRVLDLHTLRSDMYSEIWQLQWDPELASLYDAFLPSVLRMEAPQPPGIDDMCSYTCTCVWTAADNAGMVRRRPMPLDTQVWGTCEYVCQHDNTVSVDDMMMLERGEFPRKLWWEDECRTSQLHVRTCERLYHKCQSRLVHNVRTGAYSCNMVHEQSRDVLEQRRDELLTCWSNASCDSNLLLATRVLSSLVL